MKSAKSSSTALQGTLMFKSNSCNSSPESKTTSNSTNKASLKLNSSKPNVTILKRMNNYYSKVDKVRSNLLILTNNDVVKRKKFFEEVSVLQSICIHQEFDVTSRETDKEANRYYTKESEMYMGDSSAIDFKLFHSSPDKVISKDRRESSKQLSFHLFYAKRDSKIIHNNSDLEEKKPFVKRLSSIASNLRHGEKTIKSSDKINDLQLLSLMIRENGVDSPVKRDSASSLYPLMKFHNSDNNIKKNSFRENNTIRQPGKTIRSSQTLCSDVIKKVSNPSNSELRNKEKSHKTSNILILIPCGTKPNDLA